MTDILSSALIQSMARSLSVSDVIRTADTLKQSGQTRSVLTLYATWIQHNQDHPLSYAILFNYAVMLTDAGELVAATAHFEHAIAVNPDFIPAYINLGRVYERLGRAGAAVTLWSAGLARTAAIHGSAITHKITALNQCARALESSGQDEAAEDLLRQSLEIDPHQREVMQHYIALRQRQFKWPVLAPAERVGRADLLKGISPLSAGAFTDDPLLQLAIAAEYNREEIGVIDGAMAWTEPEAVPQRLRIGYLSSDLREHAVGFLMSEVFGLHDRNQVEVFAYYCGPESHDALHYHFQSTADHCVSIRHLDDAAAAERIASDGIHILVDLNGYTREARLKVVGLRPAPIIVNWLGFPGSMASPYHHYLIADEWIIPPSEELYYSERVLRLPCYQPTNRYRTVAPVTPARKDAGLPEDAIVYCCFNGSHKINRFTFHRWLMILAQVPNSVLWLLSSTEATNTRLRAVALENGIDPQRIIFAEKLANPHHLARYVLADLFLDTTPYGAHTTASDALWMGVPVLTMSGRSFASRVCGSLIRSAGLPELLTNSTSEFVELAVELGRDHSRLLECRERLQAVRNSCTLFDTPLLVQRLEGLYRHMWDEYMTGELPIPDLANLDVVLELGSQVNHDELEVQTLEDYESWWAEKLAARSKFRPFAPDRRLELLRMKVGSPRVMRGSMCADAPEVPLTECECAHV
jgi:predicted O-linked N-acetylglucosamine transferase (SPINDLY family)